MRLPSPLAAYRRWRFRRLCEDIEKTIQLAERLANENLNEIGQSAHAAGVKAASIITDLARRGYKGEALLMEMRRQLGVRE